MANFRQTDYSSSIRLLTGSPVSLSPASATSPSVMTTFSRFANLTVGCLVSRCPTKFTRPLTIDFHFDHSSRELPCAAIAILNGHERD